MASRGTVPQSPRLPPSSNAKQGSQCRPVGLGRHVGPSAISRKFPAIILGTESHGGNSKEHNYPRLQDYSLYYGAHQRTSQPPQETTRGGTGCPASHWNLEAVAETGALCKRPNPTADQPHEQCNHPPPPCPRAKWGKREPSQGFRKTVVPNYSAFGI